MQGSGDSAFGSAALWRGPTKEAILKRSAVPECSSRPRAERAAFIRTRGDTKGEIDGAVDGGMEMVRDERVRGKARGMSAEMGSSDYGSKRKSGKSPPPLFLTRPSPAPSANTLLSPSPRPAVSTQHRCSLTRRFPHASAPSSSEEKTRPG
ncbi:hypothetical protein P4O66_004235 [Electrophorus voltai]|uniref:Uncharacterized protein n=1 Tax=Electrophorus voltai TaxID=2609070 RepID=A0AAD8ZPN2_9TELE|nr:hypothetical protein P4O66_004235 [Electrophorus voltai]